MHQSSLHFSVTSNAISGGEDHRKYDFSISQSLNGLFTKFRSGVSTLQKITLDAPRNRLFFILGGGGGGVSQPLHTLRDFRPCLYRVLHQIGLSLCAVSDADEEISSCHFLLFCAICKRSVPT